MAENTGSQVALLHRISSIVSSDQDLESILHELVTLTMNVTNSDACLVYLIDHGTNEIVLRASQLPHDAEIGKVRLKMGEGITGWVAVHNSVVALAKNAGLVYPTAKVTPYLFQAGTDSGAWRTRGIPVYGIYPYPIDQALAGRGKPIYAEYCARCHGVNGRDFTGEMIGKVTPIEVIFHRPAA